MTAGKGPQFSAAKFDKFRGEFGKTVLVHLAYRGFVLMWTIIRGGDLRGTGGRPPKKHFFRWGTAHAAVPPIFGEVVLSDAHESMNRVKNGVFVVRKGSY